MARKSPVRHHVGMHRRGKTVVNSYYRGSGSPVAKKQKSTPKYLDTGFWTHPDGGSGKFTQKAEELSKQGQVILEVNLPNSVDSMKKERDFMWKNYHIDIGIDEENDEEFEDLFYGGDLRSFMGRRLEDGVYVIFPKYYVPGYESYWNALIKNSTVHKEW